MSIFSGKQYPGAMRDHRTRRAEAGQKRNIEALLERERQRREIDNDVREMRARRLRQALEELKEKK